MSYCRFIEAEIYLYPSKEGICCCNCSLGGHWNDKVFKTPQEALEHVKKHREAGDYVPKYVDERLLEEAK